MFFNFNTTLNYFLFNVFELLNDFSSYYWNIFYPILVTILITLLYIEYCRKTFIFKNIKTELYNKYILIELFEKKTLMSIEELRQDISILRRNMDLQSKFHLHQFNILSDKIRKKTHERNEDNDIWEKSFKVTKSLIHEVTEFIDNKFSEFNNTYGKMQNENKILMEEVDLLKNNITSTDKELESISSNFAQIYHNITSECNQKNTDLYDCVMEKMNDSISELRCNLIESHTDFITKIDVSVNSLKKRMN